MSGGEFAHLQPAPGVDPESGVALGARRAPAATAGSARRGAALALGIWLGLGCSAAPWGQWRSAYERDHPLLGQLIETRSGRRLEPQELVEGLRRAHFVLLGEKHDNPDHHVLQAWLLERLAADGSRPAVVLEMISRDRTNAVEQELARTPAEVDAWAEALDWAQSGWPDWPLYRPIFASALAHQLPLAAGDLTPTQLERVRERGLEGLDPALVARTGLDAPLSDAARAAWSAELAAGHCGMLPPSALAAMLDVQRARDGQLAASLVDAATPDGAVLIAGAGHVRRDRAVPALLARAAPGQSVAALAFVEVSASSPEVADYLEQPPLFDYLWLTPQADNVDPCVRFRQQLEQLRPAS